MTRIVKLLGLYVIAGGAVAGCFIILAIGRVTWAEVGPLISGIVLGLAGLHSNLLTAGVTVSSQVAPPAVPAQGSGPAGVGSAASSS